MNNIQNVQQGFVFRKKTEKLNWRKLASIDADYIARSCDFDALQEILLNITFCNIELEFIEEHIDPNFIKLFKLSQLIIEYLLQSQEYIFSNVHELSQELFKEKEENAKLRSEDIVKLENQIVEMKKELHNRRHIISMQQHMIQNGKESVNKCTFCSKVFITQQMLQSHIFRRHTDMTSVEFDPNEYPQEKKKSENVDQDFLQRLEKMQEEWHKKFQQNLVDLSDRLKKTEENQGKNLLTNQEVDKSNKNDYKVIKEQLEIMKEEQRKIYESEMKRMRSNFMKELKDMDEKQHKISDELQQLKETRMNGSMIGNIIDDTEADLTEQRRQEMQMMKNQFDKELKSMQIKLERQLEKKYNNKIFHLEEENKQKLNKLIEEIEEHKKIVMFQQSNAQINDPSKNIAIDTSKHIKLFQNNIVENVSDDDDNDDESVETDINGDDNQNKELINNIAEKQKPDEKIFKGSKEIQQKTKVKSPVRSKKRGSELEDKSLIIIPTFEKGKVTPQLVEDINSQLEIQLRNISVPINSTQLSDLQFGLVLKRLEESIQNLKNQVPDFENIRGKCVKIINQKTKSLLKDDQCTNLQKDNLKKINLSSTLPPRVPSLIAEKQLESSIKSKATSLQNLSLSQKNKGQNNPDMNKKPVPILKQAMAYDEDEDADDDDDDVEDNENLNDYIDNVTENDDDRDSISNIDINSSTKINRFSTNNNGSISIKNKAKQIENQLHMRSSKKPFGAIDTVPTRVSFNVGPMKATDDESLTDISIQGMDKPTPKPRSNSKNQQNFNLGNNQDIDDAGSWDSD